MKRIMKVPRVLELIKLAESVNGKLVIRYSGNVSIDILPDEDDGDPDICIDNIFTTAKRMTGELDWEYYSYKEIKQFSLPKIVLDTGDTISLAAARRIIEKNKVKL